MSITFFFIFFVACCVTASSGTLFPTGAWYESLKKPVWTPPNWAFPIAWTTLYLILSFVGMRAALNPDGNLALALWALQGSFATLWTPVFFGLKKMGVALVIMLGLWGAVLSMLICYWQLDPLLGILIVPYLFWVSYAAALNFTVWKMNPNETPRDLAN